LYSTSDLERCSFRHADDLPDHGCGKISAPDELEPEKIPVVRERAVHLGDRDPTVARAGDRPGCRLTLRGLHMRDATEMMAAMLNGRTTCS